MSRSLARPWRIFLSVAVLALTLTACQPGRLSLRNLTEALTTPTPIEEAPTLEATATPTAIETPEAGPTPTATPEPLAEADPDQAAALTTEGQELFVTSDLTGAEGKFIEAIAADPTYLPAHLGLTKVYLYWPQYWQQALATAEAAAALAPEDPETLAYLAWAQQGAHFFDDAWQTILQAVELGPDNALVHAASADILSSVYQMEEAYDHAQKAVELDSELADAWATLGSVAYALSYWDEATDAYATAAELEPDFFAWHLLVARNELNTTGDAETAQELAESAFATQGDHPWMISFAVDLATENNDWESAEAGCQKLYVYNQPHTPYPDAYSCMAGLMILQERYDDAANFQAIAEAIAAPQRLDITLLRMRLHNEQDDCDKGRELAEEWLTQRPYSVLAKRMIGVSYLCDENFAKAIEYFTEATEDMPRSIADARLLANANSRDGNASAALAALNRVKSFATIDPLYYQALYEVNLFLGQTKEALKAAQRWQVLRPESTDARESLALGQLFDGNAQAAQSAALEAIDAGATSSTVYAILGETYSREGKYKEAEENLLEALKREPDHFLARNFITSLYIGRGDCDKAEPHIRWLQENEDDSERAKRYDELLTECRQRQALFSPDPNTALDDDATVTAVEEQLREIGVEPRSVRFSEDEQGRSLVIAYESKLRAKSDEFTEQERDISREMARVLVRIDSKPDGVIVLSGAADEPQNLIYITSRAAFLWSNGDLTDEEFEDTWYLQDAAGLGE
jgi:tetratricopeptide (TPR) repeat protein